MRKTSSVCKPACKTVAGEGCVYDRKLSDGWVYTKPCKAPATMYTKSPRHHADMNKAIPIKLPAKTQHIISLLGYSKILDSSSDAPITPGSSYNVTINGFVPGEDVIVLLQSQTLKLAQEHSDSNGAVSVNITIPMNITSGQHTIVVLGLKSNKGFRQQIQVSSSVPQPSQLSQSSIVEALQDEIKSLKSAMMTIANKVENVAAAKSATIAATPSLIAEALQDEIKSLKSSVSSVANKVQDIATSKAKSSDVNVQAQIHHAVEQAIAKTVPIEVQKAVSLAVNNIAVSTAGLPNSVLKEAVNQAVNEAVGDEIINIAADVAKEQAEAVVLEKEIAKIPDLKPILIVGDNKIVVYQKPNGSHIASLNSMSNIHNFLRHQIIKSTAKLFNASVTNFASQSFAALVPEIQTIYYNMSILKPYLKNARDEKYMQEYWGGILALMMSRAQHMGAQNKQQLINFFNIVSRSDKAKTIGSQISQIKQSFNKNKRDVKQALMSKNNSIEDPKSPAKLIAELVDKDIQQNVAPNSTQIILSAIHLASSEQE